MLITDVVEYFGGGSRAETAGKLKLDPSAVSKWKTKNRNHVPVEVALLCETISKGELAFDKEHYQDELLAKFNAK